MTCMIWPLPTFTLAASVASSATKSRLVAQVPGIFDGHGRAYRSRLWKVASTMYWTCSCCAALTHLVADQPPLVTAASHLPQLLNGLGPVRSPQCRNRPPVAARRYAWRGLNRSALADGLPIS